MKNSFFATILISSILVACNNNSKQTTDNDMEEKLELTQEWDKVFPLSEKVNHKKVTFETQYGLTLAADLYTPASPDPSKRRGEKLAAIAVSGPFGAVKEQCSGLYAMKMAERGFGALAFDPSYTGESSGEPRRTASPDINTEDLWLQSIFSQSKIMWMLRKLVSLASAVGEVSPLMLPLQIHASRLP